MNELSIRLPESIHRKVKELAANEQIDIEQFIATAVAEKVSAVLTQAYLSERADLGSREKFEQAMKKVSGREPEENDKL